MTFSAEAEQTYDACWSFMYGVENYAQVRGWTEVEDQFAEAIDEFDQWKASVAGKPKSPSPSIIRHKAHAAMLDAGIAWNFNMNGVVHAIQVDTILYYMEVVATGPETSAAMAAVETAVEHTEYWGILPGFAQHYYDHPPSRGDVARWASEAVEVFLEPAMHHAVGEAVGGAPSWLYRALVDHAAPLYTQS